MESPRKFNDCYFYYYSTCTKGDNCVFRHEPSALGCESMCSAWQQGKCLDKKCRLRHMELRKNRKQIPCYWENQPGGCRKKHCPFMHKNPEARTDGIAPSQPGPPIPAQPATSVPEQLPVEQPPMNPVPPAAVTGVAPVPLLWQQQRQVVLDSAILGVLPASSDLMGGRRVMPPHEAPQPNPYAPMPVDPLVVNFEEESDNESAPSSTPTKNISQESAVHAEDTPGCKHQELLRLEQIQAEAAAYYSYETQTKEPPKEHRKLVRANLSAKYDRVSLDELAGKTNERKSLDFKVLTLDEIRARKNKNDSIITTTPITVTLNRKRKLSSQETIIDSGNKIIKVVRSNSVIYKKVDPEGSSTSKQPRVEHRISDSEPSRKRTVSGMSDSLEIYDDELEDCMQFKRVKMLDHTVKPKLIRNTSLNSDNKTESEPKEVSVAVDSKTDESDSEVQIVGDEIDIIDLDDSKLTDADVVELSEDSESDIELECIHNVPDVVASCHSKNPANTNAVKDKMNDVNSMLHDDFIL